MPADAINSAGWGYVTFLFNVEISLKCVTTGHLPSAPLPIIIREALALKNTFLTGFASGIDPELTPTWTYSLPLVRTWTNQAGMSKALSNKSSHIQTTLQFYIALSLVYVSPGDNLTDVPSRVPSASVCMLSPRVWKEIENSWGPRSIYLIALDSKAPIAAQGCRLYIFLTLPNQRVRRSHCFLSDFPSFKQLLILSKFGFKSWFSTSVSSPSAFSFYLCGIWSSPLSLLVACYLGRAIDSVLLGTLADHIVLLFTTLDNAFLS